MQTLHNRRGTRSVQSRQNSRVKELRSALGHGGRTQEGRIAIEGLHLTEEAQRSGLRTETIFVREGDESLLDTLILSEESEVLILPADVFASAVSTESPQGIAALVSPPVFVDDDAFLGIPLLVVAAGLQDPGNLGTLIRSSEAFGSTGIVALPGTVSQWNPKALRASSGSAFRLPLISASQEELITMLRQRSIRLLATTVKGGVALDAIDLVQPTALLIGNEGSGLPEALIAAADALVTIPCPGPVESLNAAVAGSVLLYEASRQRSLASNAGRKVTSP